MTETVAETRERTTEAMEAILGVFGDPVLSFSEVARQTDGFTATQLHGAVWCLLEDGRLETTKEWRLRRVR